MRFFGAHVTARVDLGPGYFVLHLGGCEALRDARPGQFVMLRGDWGRDPLLPRPFSLLEVGADGSAAVLVKTVGRGTRLLARMEAGASVSVLGPLGSSFPRPVSDRYDLLVAGGGGIPPLYFQAREAMRAGLSSQVELFLGGATAADLPYQDEVGRLGIPLHLATEDGSRGRAGLVTEALEGRLDELPGTPALLACGPGPMLEAVAALARRRQLRCWVSLEAGMACGLGACLGCAVAARAHPYLYVCQDGPVFEAEALYPAPEVAP